jgi:hypothetical protein
MTTGIESNTLTRSEIVNQDLNIPGRKQRLEQPRFFAPGLVMEAPQMHTSVAAGLNSGQIDRKGNFGLVMQ